MLTLDRFLSSADVALRTLSGAVHAARPTPLPREDDGKAKLDQGLTASERQLAGALMRVNHVGEVCAQALYQAQAMTARTAAVRQLMMDAAREETDHLAWTQHRLDELGARRSWLNPLWYGGSMAMGLLAGRLGDRASLAFLVETERQVEQHLASHLDRLPAADLRSRAVVAQMKADEAAHAEQAEAAGAARMPAPVRYLMRAAARVMTTTAHHL
jgi:3-demethoxyubiquinol 3-hydroxylase